MPESAFASLRLVVAIAWLVAIYAGATIFGRRNALPDRLRDTLAIAVAIPFVLGLLGALTWWTCIGAAVSLLVLARIRARSSRPAGGPDRASPDDSLAYAIVAATLIAVAWPQFVRPPLDGDSLAYHLPNAASWATAHSLWTSGTLYWWYPPGSELLATDMLLTGGISALPLAGACAALMLGCRLVAFAREAGFNAWQSGALSAAFLSVPIVGLQAGTLQNDLWLTAWLLEIVWALPRDRAALYRAIGVTALVKPVGMIFLAVAWGPLGLPLGAMIALVPLGLWIVHDAFLAGAATIPIAQTATIDPFGTSIAAHGVTGIATLIRAVADQGIATIVLAALLVAAPFLSTHRRLWLAALAFAVVYLFEPYGFENNAPQLANGQSLRFVMPALAIAFVSILGSVRRIPSIASIFAAILAVLGIVTIGRIFWNDSSTHATLAVAIAFLVANVVAVAARRVEISSLACVSLACYAAASLSREPIRYYEAEFPGTHVFGWLADRQPPKAIVWDIRGGMVNVVLPKTVVHDASSDPCAQARREHAIVIAADTFDPNPSAFALRRDSLKRCGSKLYEDPSFFVVSPNAERTI